MSRTAPSRLQTWAHASRVQSDEDTYDLERTVVGSVVAGVTADRCGQCGACDRSMVPLELGNREASDMEMTERNKDAPTQLDKSPDLEVPNNDMVICPKCVHQFRAIPVNVQHELADERKRRKAAEAALRERPGQWYPTLPIVVE